MLYFAGDFGDFTQKAVLANLDGTVAGDMEIEYRQGLYAYNGILAADNENLVRFDIVPQEERSVQFYSFQGELLNEVLLLNKRLPGLGITQDYFFYLRESENGYDIWSIDLSDLNNPDLAGRPLSE